MCGERGVRKCWGQALSFKVCSFGAAEDVVPQVPSVPNRLPPALGGWCQSAAESSAAGGRALGEPGGLFLLLPPSVLGSVFGLGWVGRLSVPRTVDGDSFEAPASSQQ